MLAAVPFVERLALGGIGDGGADDEEDRHGVAPETAFCGSR
jgi:hypothetical protein